MEARYIDELCREIDQSKLCSHASTLRGGIPCTIAELSRKNLSAMMGNQNCHVEITFQDNVKWLARFHLLKTSSPPREIHDWILQSEAATMIYLQRYTRIPTPKVFDWACKSDPRNEIGVDYILMEKLDGKSLDWQSATPQQREKVMQQLVDIFLEIEKHPFKAMGSLHASSVADSTIDVKGLANQSTCQVDKGPLGPFSSSLEGSQAILDSYLAMIASGEVDSYGQTDIYLTHKFCRDNVGTLWVDDAVSSGNEFFLKHPDDKGDHILVNDSFDIVGIIDWEWTQTVSKAEAFCSPCMMWPLLEFYDGSNELTTDELRLAAIFQEKGREDLANCVMNGRKVQRFFFGLGPESSFVDTQTLSNLFMGLQKAFSCYEGGLESWRTKALEKWKDDGLLVNLLRME